ncbi:MAG: hypothetical protein QXT66_06270 [Nitrososphaerota archaeon]
MRRRKTFGRRNIRVSVQQAEEEDKTVQHILPNTQAEGIGEADKGMDNLNLTVPV